MATTITAKQLAKVCNTDPKTFRRFLREHLRGQDIETPGQGGRYAFEKDEAKALRKAYSTWSAPKVKAPSVEVDEDDTVEDTDLIAELEASILAAGGSIVLDDETDEEDEDEDTDLVDLDPSDEDVMDLAPDDIEDIEDIDSLDEDVDLEA